MKGQVKAISGEISVTFRVASPAGIGKRQDCFNFALLVTATLPPSTMFSLTKEMNTREPTCDAYAYVSEKQNEPVNTY